MTEEDGFHGLIEWEAVVADRLTHVTALCSLHERHLRENVSAS
ncbi:hypothetical protein A33M_1788 [Rhodovulum sp. PH10]|nr:hypothetical protein A33M_1788 [Rhodovulum sp. PH10]